MKEENETNPKAPSANTFRIVMLASLTSTIMISLFLLFFVPLEPRLAYLVLGAIWVSEFIALGVIFSLYKRASKPKSGGLVWSGFGEQRTNFGSKPPSQRR
jgi:hypothetical protein